MKEMNFNNQENGNCSNCILYSWLRVKLSFGHHDINDLAHVIHGLHIIPRKGDFIEARDFIDKKNYSDKEFELINSLSWFVCYVDYRKDEFGFFAEIHLDGE
jgi:hypothetical protein